MPLAMPGKIEKTFLNQPTRRRQLLKIEIYGNFKALQFDETKCYLCLSFKT
jgi:hypothetical protein